MQIYSNCTVKPSCFFSYIWCGGPLKATIDRSSDVGFVAGCRLPNFHHWQKNLPLIVLIQQTNNFPRAKHSRESTAIASTKFWLGIPQTLLCVRFALDMYCLPCCCYCWYYSNKQQTSARRQRRWWWCRTKPRTHMATLPHPSVHTFTLHGDPSKASLSLDIDSATNRQSLTLSSFYFSGEASALLIIETFSFIFKSKFFCSSLTLLLLLLAAAQHTPWHDVCFSFRVPNWWRYIDLLCDGIGAVGVWPEFHCFFYRSLFCCLFLFGLLWLVASAGRRHLPTLMRKQ